MSVINVVFISPLENAFPSPMWGDPYRILEADAIHGIMQLAMHYDYIKLACLRVISPIAFGTEDFPYFANENSHYSTIVIVYDVFNKNDERASAAYLITKTFFSSVLSKKYCPLCITRGILQKNLDCSIITKNFISKNVVYIVIAKAFAKNGKESHQLVKDAVEKCSGKALAQSLFTSDASSESIYFARVIPISVINEDELEKYVNRLMNCKCISALCVLNMDETSMLKKIAESKSFAKSIYSLHS